jgi:putative ABC transport system ATP-binding protein
VEHAIQLRDVVKTYPTGAGDFVAINHLSLDVANGEFVAIVDQPAARSVPLVCS